MTPPAVEVRDAQRGQAYQQMVTVQNQFDTPTIVTLEPLGEVGSWTQVAPPSGTQVAPRSSLPLALSILVPSDAPNGLHTGYLRVIAEPKEQPSGSGFALRYAVAVVLNVTVGGEALERLRWLDTRAEDVEVGTPPRVFATVANEGNVRTLAHATAEVLAHAADTPVPGGAGAGEVEVVPGQRAEVPLVFAGPLPEGQYRARVRSPEDPAFERVVEFKVLPPGAVGKAGELRFLQHEPWVEPGLPVKVLCVFANTGQAIIARAKCSGELRLDGRLLGVFASDELVVQPGDVANLSAYVTPTQPGTYTVEAKVTYDGFESLPNESLLNVGSGSGAAGGGFALPGGIPWLALMLALLLGGTLVGVLVGRRRRRREPPAQGPRQGPR